MEKTEEKMTMQEMVDDYNSYPKKTEELEYLSNLMEEMANKPKEELGKREKGEVGLYEKYSKRSTFPSPYVFKLSKQDRFDG